MTVITIVMRTELLPFLISRDGPFSSAFLSSPFFRISNSHQSAPFWPSPYPRTTHKTMAFGNRQNVDDVQPSYESVPLESVSRSSRGDKRQRRLTRESREPRQSNQATFKPIESTFSTAPSKPPPRLAFVIICTISLLALFALLVRLLLITIPDQSPVSAPAAVAV